MKGAEAERALVLWLEAQGYTVHRAARAGFVRLANGKAFCRSHDLFGCLDILAIRRGVLLSDAMLEMPLETWAIQATTAAGRTARRRKLEGVNWPMFWRVSLVNHETRRDPADGRRVERFWRVQDYRNGTWLPPSALPA